MGRDYNKNRLICAEYWPFFSKRYICFCTVRVENKLMCGDVVFYNTSLFVMMCCVCGMRWCRWVMVLRSSPFFLRQSTLFLSTSNTFLLLINKLFLLSNTTFFCLNQICFCQDFFVTSPQF
jgi:hypothetical protein